MSQFSIVISLLGSKLCRVQTGLEKGWWGGTINLVMKRKRWRSVELSDRHLPCHEKIGDWQIRDAYTSLGWQIKLLLEKTRKKKPVTEFDAASEHKTNTCTSLLSRKIQMKITSCNSTMRIFVCSVKIIIKLRTLGSCEGRKPVEPTVSHTQQGPVRTNRKLKHMTSSSRLEPRPHLRQVSAHPWSPGNRWLLTKLTFLLRCQNLSCYWNSPSVEVFLRLTK